jgi:hypothetical protein
MIYISSKRGALFSVSKTWYVLPIQISARYKNTIRKGNDIILTSQVKKLENIFTSEIAVNSSYWLLLSASETINLQTFNEFIFNALHIRKTVLPPNYFHFCLHTCDRLCGLVFRVLGYRSGGPGSIPGTTRKK